MRDRLIHEHRHDPYKSTHKPAEPTTCPGCGAVYHRGRWQWTESPKDANEARCPACARIHDHYPAGYVNLRGEFLQAHRQEILNLVRNVEERESAEHPLKRIMDISEEDGGLLITTTDLHLARSIGDEIHRAWQGELDYKYAEESNIIHVAWER